MKLTILKGFKRLSLALALAVFITAFVPVTAKAAGTTESNWVELLETTTVNDSGSNVIKAQSSTTKFKIKTPASMRLTKVDILITHDAYGAPTNLRVQYNSGYYTLKKVVIDSNTTRFYGDNIPDTLYSDIWFEIGRSGSDVKYYQVLSCRVSQFTASEFTATAIAQINGEDYEVPFTQRFEEDAYTQSLFYNVQFPVVISDWYKYDKITVSGSLWGMALNSVRCTIGGLALPYEISYTQSNPTETESHSVGWSEMYHYDYDDTFAGTTETDTFSYIQYGGKTLFSITIDLTMVDRTNTQNLYVYFTTLANDQYGYTIQFLECTGFLSIADTSEATWWEKVKAFFSDLLGSDDAGGDEFASEMEQQGAQMEQAVDQMNQVARPSPDSINVSLSGFTDPNASQDISYLMGTVMNEQIVITPLLITLTLALASYVIFGKRG